MSAGEKRAAYIQGLRLLADALESDERIPLPTDGKAAESPIAIQMFHGDVTAEVLAAAVAGLHGTDWASRTERSTSYTFLKVAGRLAGLHVQVSADADQVCEPIEPQPVIERTCPALDAVIAGVQEGGQS
jgi:hypothetical protein